MNDNDIFLPNRIKIGERINDFLSSNDTEIRFWIRESDYDHVLYWTQGTDIVPIGAYSIDRNQFHVILRKRKEKEENDQR